MTGDDGWRLMDGARCAWFDAPGWGPGAELVQRALAGADGRLLGADLRSTGVRLRLATRGAAPDDGVARALSRAAHELGLVADPSALQDLHLLLDSPDPDALLPFWRTTTGYSPAGPHRLEDPDHRGPRVGLRRCEPRPLRGRTHVDVVRPPAAVEAARAVLGQEPHGPHGLALADPDGNEVDLVPGDPLGEGPGTEDWRVLFAAVARYPVGSPDVAAQLVAAVARLAHDAGFPLLVDVRPGTVTVDSGKDRWQDEAYGAARFLGLAAGVQAAARDLGLHARTDTARFVQVCVDAVDVPAGRAFWAQVLGYRADEREHVWDLVDPRGLGPVVMFQDMDPDEGRLAQPDRVRPELHVPGQELDARTDAAVAAGGRLVGGDARRRTVADPEGHELELVGGP